MILDEIKKANVEAIKSKDTNARSILSVVINKAMQETIKKRATGGQLVDADLVAIIQKTIKELNEEKLNYEKVGNIQNCKAIEEQKKLIEKYLPQMMTDAEIRDIILSLDDKSIPFVMKYFKANYNGKCEMGRVQQILKSL